MLRSRAIRRASGDALIRPSAREGSGSSGASIRSAGRGSGFGASAFFSVFAAGGMTPANQPFWAGEQGPELVFPTGRPQYVMNGRDSARYSTARAPASPMNARPVQLYGGGLGQLVFTWLRDEIASRGGTLAVLGLRDQ